MTPRTCPRGRLCDPHGPPSLSSTPILVEVAGFPRQSFEPCSSFPGCPFLPTQHLLRRTSQLSSSTHRYPPQAEKRFWQLSELSFTFAKPDPSIELLSPLAIASARSGQSPWTCVGLITLVSAVNTLVFPVAGSQPFSFQAERSWAKVEMPIARQPRPFGLLGFFKPLG